MIWENKKTRRWKPTGSEQFGETGCVTDEPVASRDVRDGGRHV